MIFLSIDFSWFGDTDIGDTRKDTMVTSFVTFREWTITFADSWWYDSITHHSIVCCTYILLSIALLSFHSDCLVSYCLHLPVIYLAPRPSRTHFRSTCIFIARITIKLSSILLLENNGVSMKWEHPKDAQWVAYLMRIQAIQTTRARTFWAVRKCVQIPATHGCALSCWKVRWWRWMKGTTMCPRILLQYLYTFKLLLMKYTWVGYVYDMPIRTETTPSTRATQFTTLT